jgi:hypothetical protein
MTMTNANNNVVIETNVTMLIVHVSPDRDVRNQSTNGPLVALAFFLAFGFVEAVGALFLALA